MGKKEMVWHAYHADFLCQYVDFDKRLAFIRANKPSYELPMREQLMKRVIGKLPSVFVEACVVEEIAWEAREAAWSARETAWEAREAAWSARETVQKAWEVWETAREAREAAYRKYKPEIERLHAVECPDCPWDGETIFSITKK